MASPDISFEQIPASTRKPGQYLEWNTKLAMQGLSANRQKVLLIGQHCNSALGACDTIQSVFDDSAVADRCGAGSMIHLMARAALTAYPYAALSMIAIADATAGVAATAKITIAGPATGQGILRITIGNADTVPIAVTSGDSAAIIATEAAQALNAARHLPVTATTKAGVVTLSAKNAGAEGNAIALKISGEIAGLKITRQAFAGGDGNPSLADALAAVAAEGHDLIACGLRDPDNLLRLKDHADSMADPREKRWVNCVYAMTGTLAEATTQARSINSGFVSSPWYRGSPSLPAEIAAAYAAVAASEEDPARPLQTLELKGIGVCALEAKTLRAEQENALYNGVAPIETSPSGSAAQIVRAVTTYVVSATGTPDESLLDLTTVRTLIYTSKQIIQRIALRFPREKLSNKTPPKVRSEILDVLLLLEELEILENVEANKARLIVERDLQNTGMLDAKIPADVVNGLHVFAAVVDLYL